MQLHWSVLASDRSSCMMVSARACVGVGDRFGRWSRGCWVGAPIPPTQPAAGLALALGGAELAELPAAALLARAALPPRCWPRRFRRCAESARCRRRSPRRGSRSRSAAPSWRSCPRPRRSRARLSRRAARGGPRGPIPLRFARQSYTF
jgi:hypothetical protein